MRTFPSIRTKCHVRIFSEMWRVIKGFQFARKTSFIIRLSVFEPLIRRLYWLTFTFQVFRLLHFTDIHPFSFRSAFRVNATLTKAFSLFRNGNGFWFEFLGNGVLGMLNLYMYIVRYWNVSIQQNGVCWWCMQYGYVPCIHVWVSFLFLSVMYTVQPWKIILKTVALFQSPCIWIKALFN